MEMNVTKIWATEFFLKRLWKRRVIIPGMRSRVRRRGPSVFTGRQLLPGLHAARRVSIQRSQFTNYTYQISRENLISSSVLC